MINLKNLYLSFKSSYKDSLINIVLVCLILFIQDYLVYPFEKYLFNSSAIDFVSIFFLPHGVKIILYFIYKSKSIFPIFFGTYIYGFSLPFQYSHLFGSIIGILAIFLSFQVCSYLLNPVSLKDKKQLPLWRLLIVVTFLSSLINAFMQSMLASFTFKEYNLNLLFLTGDLIGSLTIIFIVIYFRLTLLRIMTK